MPETVVGNHQTPRHPLPKLLQTPAYPSIEASRNCMKITRSLLSRQNPVNIERTQHIGHYGVTFTVMRFTVVPENRNALGSLCLLGAGNTANELRSHIRDLYEKMLARDLPCKMKLAISKPLNRQQADVLNTRAGIISGLIGGALAAPISLVSRPIGGIVGATATLTVKGIIRSYHAGDVVIGLDAQVSGGIGPQRSLSAMVRQFQGG